MARALPFSVRRCRLTITLTGIAQRILFPRDGKESDNGYAIIAFSPDEKHPEINLNSFGSFTAKGTLLHIREGMSVRLTGEVAEDTRYGSYFKVETAIPILPKSREEVLAVLSSGIIHGVNEIMAMRIVDEFGAENVFDVLDNTPERLSDVRGIGEKTAEKIAESWEEYRVVVDLLAHFAKYDVSTSVLIRAHKKWGGPAVQKMTDNPYCITQLFGVGFIVADKFAASMGIVGADPRRITAGIEYTLEVARGNGHVCLPDDELVTEAQALFEKTMGIYVDTNALEIMMEQLISSGLLIASVLDGKRYIYHPQMHSYETAIAEKIHGMLAIDISPVSALFADESVFNDELRSIEENFGFEFAESQRTAVRLALTNRVSIITGSPGVGKTTIIRAIVKMLRKKNFVVALTAPTGKAAMRIEEVTGVEAKTIHRLLGAQHGGKFLYNENNPLEAEYIIVDEFSMVDTHIAARLLSAMDDRTHVLFVGDIDQLPSVGAGNVLRDMITSGAIPVVRLSVIFRQEHGSNIVENVHRINRGDTKLMYSVVGTPPEDMFFFRVDDNEQILAHIVGLVSSRLKERFGYGANDVQILTPMRKGILGANNINAVLQNILNPADESKEEHTTKNGTIYRVGDRVMQIVNNYDKDVYNGETGVIVRYDTLFEEYIVKFIETGREIAYETVELPELRHSWATTIHKSQGSEYPVVIVVMTKSHYIMLARNLLYTAVSRARKMAIIIGQSDAVSIAIRTNKVEKRYTGLKYRLAKNVDRNC